MHRLEPHAFQNRFRLHSRPIVHDKHIQNHTKFDTVILLFEVKLCAKAVTDQKAKQYGERGHQGGNRWGHSWTGAMSNVISSKPQTTCQTFVHPLSVSAKGVDHVPVSHHAAGAIPTNALHYRLRARERERASMLDQTGVSVWRSPKGLKVSCGSLVLECVLPVLSFFRPIKIKI